MAMRLKLNPTFRAKVHFAATDTTDGTERRFAAELEFRRVGPEALHAREPRDLLREVLINWRMEDLDRAELVPFSDDARDEFAAMPGAAPLLAVQRFLEGNGVKGAA